MDIDLYFFSTSVNVPRFVDLEFYLTIDMYCLVVYVDTRYSHMIDGKLSPDLYG